MTTVDDLLKELGTKRIDMVKMDIEGSEDKALIGAFIKNMREIVVETHGKENEEAIIRVLNSLGFKVEVWGFQLFHTIFMIAKHPITFFRAEISTGWRVAKLAFDCLLSARASYPIPASDPRSNSRLKIIIARRP